MEQGRVSKVKQFDELNMTIIPSEKRNQVVNFMLYQSVHRESILKNVPIR
jgi:hypothetical protein